MRMDAALRQASLRLGEAGIEQPRCEARLLASFLLGLAPGVLPDPDTQLDEAALRALVARRAAREPMALITGRRGFWTLDLEVSPDTLIPRPDSETLIEAACAAFPDRGVVRQVLDLGTGTGCLLLAALSEFPQASGLGVDISPGAARLARRNAAAAGMGHRASFAAGSWADALAGRFDLILCNPPYIPSAHIAGLMPEVSRHEPARALDGGADGLGAYRALIPRLPALLQPCGIAVLEVGAGQATDVTNLAQEAGFTHVDATADLQGIPRALRLRMVPPTRNCLATRS